MNAARFLRGAITVILVATASGAPRAAVALFADDCCVAECDGGGPDKSCPPECPSASCVKATAGAAQPAATASISVFHADDGAALSLGWHPVLPLVTGGVFHPPRR